jgi:hypothetical protein
MLDESIEAHIEKKRTEAISLQYATANRYKRGAEFGGNY